MTNPHRDLTEASDRADAPSYVDHFSEVVAIRFAGVLENWEASFTERQKPLSNPDNGGGR